MSDFYSAGSVGIGDLVTTLKIANQNMSQLIQAINAIFPRVTGTFTMAAAATTVVAQPNVTANCVILLQPANAAAATMVGSNKSPYISATTAGASFTIATASSAAAAGTETFLYSIVNLG